MLQFFTLLFILLASSQTFLPTQYSTLKPFQFDIERRTFALSIQLCAPAVYTGCQMTATVNCPFTPWAVEDGTYTNFTVSSAADNCAAVICQNNAKATSNPNRCSFVYNPSYGPRLYVTGTAGNAAGFQGTFNLEVNCTKKSEIPEKNFYGLNTMAPCPASADTTKRTILFDIPGQVPTSSRTADAAKYQIAVCPDRQVFAKVDYSLQAVDKNSAFASYFCNTGPCNVDISPVGWRDDSGTALNAISLSNLQNQMLWLNVYGWGQFEGRNTYVFHMEISDV